MKFRLCCLIMIALLIAVAVHAAPSLEAKVTAQINHPEAWVQARACYLLGEFCYAESAPVLLQIAYDTHRANIVRIHALLALGRMGNPTGQQFCRDLAGHCGWFKTVKAQTAQSDLMMLLATRTAAGSNSSAQPASQNLAKTINGAKDAWASLRDCGHPLTADQALVLLDRHDHIAWTWLAQDFVDNGDRVRAAAVKRLAAELNKPIKFGTTFRRVAVYAKAREKTRES